MTDPLKKFTMGEVSGVGWLMTPKVRTLRSVAQFLILLAVIVGIIMCAFVVGEREQAARDYAIWLRYCNGNIQHYTYCYTDLRDAKTMMEL